MYAVFYTFKRNNKIVNKDCKCFLFLFFFKLDIYRSQTFLKKTLNIIISYIVYRLKSYYVDST